MAVLRLAADCRTVPPLETARAGDGRLMPKGLRFRDLIRALQLTRDRGAAPSDDWRQMLEPLGLVAAGGGLTPAAERLLAGWRRRIRVGALLPKIERHP